MAGKRLKRRSRLRGQLKAALAEFVRLIEQVPSDKATTRLQLDMARDAGVEVFRQMLGRLEYLEEKVARLRNKREAARNRLLSLLTDLSVGPIPLPRPRGLPPVEPEDVVQLYLELGARNYPDLARTLHDAAGSSDVVAYQRFLVEEILLKGNAILAEHLVREANKSQPFRNEGEFLERLRHHLAGKVHRKLARQTGYQVSPEVGTEINSVLVRSLRFLLDLLTSHPPGRLIFPTLGSDFDPQRHEAIPGRPTTGTLLVRATIFPGYVILSDSERIVAKALVYTKRVESSGQLPGI